MLTTMKSPHVCVCLLLACGKIVTHFALRAVLYYVFLDSAQLVPPCPSFCFCFCFCFRCLCWVVLDWVGLCCVVKVNRSNVKGETALMHGAASGNLKIVRMLMQVRERGGSFQCCKLRG